MSNFKELKTNIGNSLLSYKKINKLFHRESVDYKNEKVNLGQLQAYFNSQKQKINCLNEVEFQVFSQYGDDGIIQYLINKLPIKNKTFIEIGVENYKESNTRFLLVNNYWTGFVVDGNEEKIKELRAEQLYNSFDITAVSAFVTKENINEILSQSKFIDKEIGLLSLDIDGNDYWVLEAMSIYQPSIIIVEYNGLFGFEEKVTIPYQTNFKRGIQSLFNFYGMSLNAAHHLLNQKGYTFIGCNSIGNNAYFVAHHFMNEALPKKTIEEGYQFPKFSEAWNNNKECLRGKDNVMSLQGKEVVDVETQDTKALQSNIIWQQLLQTAKVNRA